MDSAVGWSGGVGEEFGSWGVLEEGGDGFAKEGEDASAGLGAGGDRGPDAFEPALAGVAARALCDLAVDDDETDRLFGEIVCGFEAWGGDEAEITFAVLVKAFGEVSSFLGAGDAVNDFGPQFVAGVLQSDGEGVLGVLVASVDDGEEIAKLAEDALSVGLVFGVRMLDEKADIAQQMSEAELDENVGVFHEFAVGGEVIAADEAVEVIAEGFEQDVGAARRIDLKEGEERSTEAPGPHASFVIFVSGFIDVENRLRWQTAGEVFVSAFDAVADLGDDFGEIAATDLNVEEIAEKAFDGGVRTVTNAFEITDEGSEPGPSEAGLGGRPIERRVMDLPAFAAPPRMRTNAGDRNHLGRQRQFDLLNDFGGQLAGNDRPMTIGTFGAEDFGVSDVGVVEGLAPLGIMAGLSAAFAFGVALLRIGFWPGLFSKVAGGRLGRVAGVLFERSDLGPKRRNFRFELLDHTQQSDASCARGHPGHRHGKQTYPTAANGSSEFKDT